MLNNNIITKNRVYAPIIVGIALLLIVLALYPIYTQYLDTRTTILVLEKSKGEKEEKINEIKKMQALFAGSGSNEVKTKVSKYNHSFITSDIMEVVMVNKFTKSSVLTPPSITVGSISINAGKKLPSGLSLGTVADNISADSPDQIVDYLTYLTTESPLAFTIDSISLPLDTSSLTQTPTALSLSISLGVYYYE